MSVRATRCLVLGLVLVVVSFAAINVSAAIFEVPTDQQLVEQSDLIVIATPVASRVELDPTGVPVTITTMRIDKRIAGESESTIEVRERGGWFAGRGAIVTGSPQFEKGEQVFLFLQRTGGGQFRSSSMALGKFDYVRHGDETLLVRGLADGSLCALSADGSIGHDVVRTAAFVDWTREMATAGKSRIRYESAVSHEEIVRAASATVSPATTHRADYLLTANGSAGTRPVRWQNPSMAYKANGTQPGIDGLAGSQAAASAWNAAGTDVSISVAMSSCVSSCERVPDGETPAGLEEMAIILGGDPGDVSGTVGETFVAGVVFWVVNSTYVLDGETFYGIDHADIIVSSTLNPNQALFNAIVTHEMGHAIGLRHSNSGIPSSSSAIMNSNVSAIGANLQVWDLDAVQTVYGDGPACRIVDITSQTSDSTIGYLQSKTLSVSVSASTTNPSYQWYTSSSSNFGTATPISGAVSSSYNTGPLTDGTYYYWAKVTNECSSEVTNPIRVTVNPCIPASIVTEPADKEILAGETATLRVTADGSTPLSYQWYRGERGNTGSPIIGETFSSYQTPPLNATASYWVAVRNDCGSADSRTVTVTVANGCDLPTITAHPASQTVTEGTQVSLNVSATSSNGALSYAWFAATGAEPVPVGTNSPTLVTAPIEEDTRYYVEVSDSCGTVVSNVATITVLGCQPPVVESLTPNAFIRWGATATLTVQAAGDQPLSYQWFNGVQGDDSAPINGATGNSYETPALTAKSFFWVRVTNACASTNSSTVVIEPVCLAPDPPSIGVLPVEVRTGVPYQVSWSRQPGVTSYELQESATPDFASPTTFQVEGHSRQFVKAVAEPTRFYYRARGSADCDGSIGVFSQVISVAVIPPPPPTSPEFDVVVPEDASTPITLTVFVPGLGTDTPFTVETTIDWLTVSPSSGTLPAAGMTFTVVADVTQMQLGSNTGSFSVIFGSAAKQAASNHGTTVPVTVTLVTPVSTSTKTRPADNSLILLGVAHAAGFNSQWQSDIRLLNIGTSPAGLGLKYVPAGAAGFQNVKATSLQLTPGVNTALNDVVKNVYGVGSTGDSQVGSLEIQATSNGSLATIASSRTFNKSASGTFGQFIPAIPFFRFIGTGEPGQPKPKLSMQQISQSDRFRTNVAILEASGTPTSVVVSVFNTSGQKVADLPFNLGPGELKTLNSLLANNAITLEDGRLEVTVTGGGGRVHAYASVVDNDSNDPFLVPAVDLTDVSATRWVLPGMADFQTGQASWRSDVRILNAGSSTARPTLTFYPQGGGTPTSVNTSIAPGETKVLNDLLRQTFQRDSIGGALHISTTSPAQLVATARTYDLQETGTYGQFIPAITEEAGFGLSSRPTYVLQLEESEFFRSNLGIAEITGKPVLMRLSASVPGGKSSVSTQIGLDGFGFTQLNRVLTSFLGTGTSFNGRVTIEVINGEGKITAYGSVIDNITQDPTYVPGQ